MKNRKFVAILLLALITIHALIPASAMSETTELSQNDVVERIMSMQEAYPDGMHWTNQSPTPAYTWVFPGSLWSMGGCAAFAAIIQDAAFGPIKDIPPTWQRINDICHSSGVAESPAPFSWETLWPGDILRFKGHSVIVVEKHLDHVVVAEGNYSAQIKWGRTITRNSVEQSGQYVLTRYSKSEKLMPYTDLPLRKQWSWTPVTWSILNDIADPITPMEFMPQKDCTRGETITFLWKAFGSPEPAGSSRPFTDVQATAPYYKAVYWAYENGITAGTSKTTFSPEEITTRAHALTFLWRATGSQDATITISPFDDVQANRYYYHALLWAYENGVTCGTSQTTFSPDNNCSRAESIGFLYRAVEGGFISTTAK